MKLLVLTQKVDEQDDVLGFFHEWLRRLANKVETLEVICLSAGPYTLPPNVHVYSLGKEEGKGRLVRLVRLYSLLWKLQSKYDAVFVHMNPEYLVAAGWWWKLARKKTLLWYSHKSIDLKLRIAVWFSGTIASSAKSSFRLWSRKLRVTGHGIDTDHFAPAGKALHFPLRVLSVGRITPIKRLETLISALAVLRERGVGAHVELVGEPGSAADLDYKRRLEEHIRSLRLAGSVTFVGSVPYKEIPAFYRHSDLSVNLAPTGGLDKAVLESMAVAVPALVSNRGFSALLGEQGSRLLFEQDDPADLADKIEALAKAEDLPALGNALREKVLAGAGLDGLIDKLLALLS